MPNARTHRYAIALAKFELGDYKAAVEALTHTEGQDQARTLRISWR